MCGDWYVTAPAGAPKVQIVTITTCSSAGEALRAIDQKNLIKSDFVLVHPRLVPMGSTGGQDPALSAAIANGTSAARSADHGPMKFMLCS